MGNSTENIGFSLHTVLAMNPQKQEILGCLTLEPFIRKLTPIGETRVPAKEAPTGIAGLGTPCANHWTSSRELPMDLRER